MKHRITNENEVISWEGFETEKAEIRLAAVEINESYKALQGACGLTDTMLAGVVGRGVRERVFGQNAPLDRAVRATLALRELTTELVSKRDFNYYLIHCEWSPIFDPSKENCERCDKLRKEVASGKHSNHQYDS